MEMRTCSGDIVTFGAMLLVECANVGLNVVVKAATSRGMSNFVCLVYSYILSTLVLLPFSFIFSRALPPLTLSLVCKFFLLGLVSYSGQIFSYTGIKYSSPTLAAAMSNLIPGFTFILAILFRMERLDLRSSRSIAKLLGTLISIGGALVATLYKGPQFMTNLSPFHLENRLLLPHSSPSNWALGGFFLLADCLSFSLCNVFQASILNVYPSEITMMLFSCFFAIIPSSIASVIAERDVEAWRLGLDIELIAILYMGLVWFGFAMVLRSWGVHKKGPVYVVMFAPLGIIIAAIMGIIFLDDTLHLGSVIGSIIIVLGFYCVMWGKAKEDKMGTDRSEHTCLEASTQQTPLLQSGKMGQK